MPTKIKGKKAVKTMQKDPVCGAEVDPQTAVKDVNEGKDYYFCSEDCRQKFEEDPSSYKTF